MLRRNFIGLIGATVASRFLPSVPESRAMGIDPAFPDGISVLRPNPEWVNAQYEAQVFFVEGCSTPSGWQRDPLPTRYRIEGDHFVRIPEFIV